MKYVTRKITTTIVNVKVYDSSTDEVTTLEVVCEGRIYSNNLLKVVKKKIYDGMSILKIESYEYKIREYKMPITDFMLNSECIETEV